MTILAFRLLSTALVRVAVFGVHLMPAIIVIRLTAANERSAEEFLRSSPVDTELALLTV